MGPGTNDRHAMIVFMITGIVVVLLVITALVLMCAHSALSLHGPAFALLNHY